MARSTRHDFEWRLAEARLPAASAEQLKRARTAARSQLNTHRRLRLDRRVRLVNNITMLTLHRLHEAERRGDTRYPNAQPVPIVALALSPQGLEAVASDLRQTYRYLGLVDNEQQALSTVIENLSLQQLAADRALVLVHEGRGEESVPPDGLLASAGTAYTRLV